MKKGLFEGIASQVLGEGYEDRRRIDVVFDAMNIFIKVEFKYDDGLTVKYSKKKGILTLKLKDVKVEIPYRSDMTIEEFELAVHDANEDIYKSLAELNGE